MILAQMHNSLSPLVAFQPHLSRHQDVPGEKRNEYRSPRETLFSKILTEEHYLR